MNFDNKKLITILENEIKAFNQKVNKGVNLNDFKAFNTELKTIEDSVEQKKDHLKEYISLMHVGIQSIGTLVFLFHEEEKFIDGDWVNEEYTRINWTFQGLLTQLTNGLIGIAKLVEGGLDYQARVLLRNVTELSWLILVLFYDETYLSMYILGDKFKKQFKPYKIRNKLNEIERAIKLPKSIKAKVTKNRSHSYKFYSEIMHNHYPYPILGAITQGIDEEDNFQLNTFGKITKSSKSTLNEANTCIYLFLLMFYKALVDIHKFKVNEENEEQVYFARKSFILKNTFIKGYQSMLQR